MTSKICGNFKFQSEENYADFLEAMGANKEMVDRVMSSLPNVRFFVLFLVRNIETTEKNESLLKHGYL